MAEEQERLLKRVKPYDSEIEQALLGAIVIDNRKLNEILDMLPDGRSFYNRSYGAIYDAMVSLNKAGIVIEPLTLMDKLQEMNVPPEVINPEFLRNALSTTTSANVSYYARLVMEKAMLRDLIDVTEEITNDCYEARESVEELFARTEKKIFNIVQRRIISNFKPIGDVVWEALQRIEAAAKTTGDVTGLATGFLDLDHKTAGLQPGNLVLVAARPAMGKTSFVLSMVRNVAIRQNKPVLMFSLEMSVVELMNRLLSMTSFVDSKKFKTGQLDDGEWEKLVESGGDIAHSNLILDDTATTLGEIRSKARKCRLENKIELVVIDYLQLMNSNSKRADSRQQEISEISRGLKLLALELGIPIIALSQLSRAVETRTDHRPILSDLRESGAIEQDADIVMFIYRDEVYHPEDESVRNKAEIILAKHRNGKIGTIDMVWVPERTQFENLIKENVNG